VYIFCKLTTFQHGEVVQKLRSEIESNQESVKVPATVESLSKLPYSDSIAKETLRQYPAIPLMPAFTKTEFAFQGYRIPKGVVLLGGFYATHHDDTVYIKPGKL
jgi:cytochrome P450